MARRRTPRGVRGGRRGGGRTTTGEEEREKEVHERDVEAAKKHES